MPSHGSGAVDPARLAAALALTAALRRAGLTPRRYTLRRPDVPVRVTIHEAPRRRWGAESSPPGTGPRLHGRGVSGRGSD